MSVGYIRDGRFGMWMEDVHSSSSEVIAACEDAQILGASTLTEIARSHISWDMEDWTLAR